MASDVLFEVDASQILAKLHLAGLQPCKYDQPKEFFVNTGIKNDDPNAKPDKPGKVTFDLKNSSGEYEIGFVMEIQYKKEFGVENKFNEIQKIIAKTANTKIDSKLEPKEQEDLDKLKDEIAAITGVSKKELKDQDSIDNAIENYKSNIAKDNKTASYDGFNDAVKEASKKALANLNKYMSVFAGKDNVKPIDEKNSSVIVISPKVKDANDSSLVKMFEIVPISDAENAKQMADFRATIENNRAAFEKDSKKKNCIQKICFKAKYELNVDK